jgi:hypothetical protein
MTGMKCRKCGMKLHEEYLGEENRRRMMCSPCIAGDTILIRPKLAFRNAGEFGFGLNPKKSYLAHPAINQPDFRKKGLVFVNAKGSEFLLEKKDYTVVKRRSKRK